MDYFSMKSRKNGCFGAVTGGIEGLLMEPIFVGFELAGLGGALGSGGGSRGPNRPQAATTSVIRTASAGRRARPAKRYEYAVPTSDSGWSAHYTEKAD